MITIDKPEKVPDKLIEIQNEIADDLFNKKQNFNWNTKHYSVPIKDILKALYHNKCAFCECELSEYDNSNKFTVEHYRPKEYYFWLGAEWTNLFPTCKSCNGKKGKEFPLLDRRNKIKIDNAPFDKNGKLIPEKCNIKNVELLNEKPLILHPEIDEPEKYFEFNIHGKAIPKSDLSDFEIKRANQMLLFLNLPIIEEKRKRKIYEFQQDLRETLDEFVVNAEGDFRDHNIKLGFQSFFRKLLKQKEPTSEFSLLGACMIEKFDVFFLEIIERKFNIQYRKLVEYAFNLFIIT